MSLFAGEWLPEEKKILACLKEHGELTMSEIGSFLGISWCALYQPIVNLIYRGLVSDKIVEGIGKFPAIQSWGLKFYLLEKDKGDWSNYY